MPVRILCLLICLIMLAACNEVAPTVTPSPTATITPSPVPSATAFVVPTLPPTETPIPVTPSPTAVRVEPLTGIIIEPPIDIDIPPGWEFGYDTMFFNDLGDLNTISFALYRGDVSGGTARIILLWNFGSVTPGNPNSEFFNQPNLWLDGIRLLRTIVIEQTCNVGTDLQRDFTIGDLPATGTYWSAIDCGEDLPDTSGWFAGLNVDGINFLFYAYGTPLDAMNGNAPQEIQTILDSVDFRVLEFIAEVEAASTATAEAEVTTEP
ncbi:MAG: hypothetical protein ACPG7F_01610 [Aggregatilineales bacterium]